MSDPKRRHRMPPESFQLPTEALRTGWYSDKYFVRTRDILIADDRHPRVVMQVFTRRPGIACGLDEAIAVLRLAAKRPKELFIDALHDGDAISESETVMLIEGDYSTFAHLETVYLGVLTRGSSIATNVRRVVEVAGDRPVLFFSARFDHYSVQPSDGYAAFVGGAAAVSTDANTAWWPKQTGEGTIPHGLIAAYEGDTMAATEAFDRHIEPSARRIALVDFDNDCVKTSLEVARSLGERLWGVRLDTAGNLRDKSVKGTGPDSYGVCAELVWNVRRALDAEGFRHVRIVVSGGFNVARIALFCESGVPFDAVGVGTAFYKDRMEFTADIVQVNGKPCAKVGRQLRPNPRLLRVE